ncbi:MAG TPA: pyridoxamine 5'-phosphate oxidase family protein [Acidimicrobiia bacterium]|nr:pyridoxamine 5'-phosphate oxidase family protein [Acidimicrobiia bacterium]
MTEPVADRPDMPEGYLGHPPLPWSWAEQQLLTARNYWITTIGPKSRPHVRPVWGVWLDDSLLFSTGARHGTHISRDPRVTVNLEDADECLILEGTAEAVADETVRRAFADAHETKYDWPLTLDFLRLVYVVHPSVAFGWLAYDIAPEATLFQSTATRWRFTASP